MKISKKKLSSMVDSLRYFLKAFDQASMCIHNPLSKPKLKLNLQSHKIYSLLIIIKISLNIQMDKFVYRFGLEKTILASYQKNLNYTVVNLNLQEMSTLTMMKFTTSTRIDITLQVRND